MKRKDLRMAAVVVALIAATCVAMAYLEGGAIAKGGASGASGNSGIGGDSGNSGAIGSGGAGALVSANAAGVRVSGRLSQDRVALGGDGQVALELTFAADPMPNDSVMQDRSVDMVIVLDRSGSMEGDKIADARRAVLHLMENLTAADRFALVTYSDDVRVEFGLTPMSAGAGQRLSRVIQSVYAGGATNLGGGLEAGIRLLSDRRDREKIGRVLLISDGLANRGVVEAGDLGNMASLAVERAFSVSTVGVGADFNEQLMTGIADRGAGTYHYLDDPAAFAAVFKKEFFSARAVAAANLVARVPLGSGMSVAAAAGYPVRMENNVALIHPGDLLAGQTRTLFLTLRVPTGSEASYSLKDLHITYDRAGASHRLTLESPFTIACVADKAAVVSSIDADVWGRKVIQEDYNKLKEQVAADMKEGKREAALGRIQQYEAEQGAANEAVGSVAVEENLKKDVGSLRQRVEDVFASPAPAAAQQSEAKALQFDAYKGRRMK